MYILGFETTGNIGTCGLLDLDGSGQDLLVKSTREPMSHLRLMGSLAQELFREAGISDPSSELAAVAASIGPGSFTGIRIGVTMARSMAQALNIPGISVPTLEIFRPGKYGAPSADIPVAAIINARRGQVYGAVYDASGEDLLMPGPYMLTDVLEITDGYSRVKFFGDGIDAYWDQLTDGEGPEGMTTEDGPNGRIFAQESERYQRVEGVLRIAKYKFDRGEAISFDELLPDYMRLAEAEQKLRDAAGVKP